LVLQIKVLLARKIIKVELILKYNCSSGKKAELHDKDNPDWVPSLKLGGQKVTTPNPGFISPQLGRYNRIQQRTKRKLDLDTEEVYDIQQCDDSTTTQGTQTDIDSRYMEGMQSELTALRTEIDYLKSVSVSSKITEEAFQGNDVKVNCFTGLASFATLMVLFNYLKEFIPVSDSLTKFQILMMTLLRFRFNLSVLFLAHEFNISQPTVSRLLNSMIDVMYYRLKRCINWPERETLVKTMPMQFRKHFGTKCAVIIDCFEIFIENPSNVKARAETWSAYKHHNTVKFLIGITPTGSVSFLSKSWGGRVSDKYITEHCGFLDKILPGDLILADRGFDIKESVGSLCGHVYTPAFTRGQRQLSAADIESTRKLANVRIHVECIIGTVRQKYPILNGTVPIRLIMGKDENGLTMIDKIGVVCCSLINLNNPVICSD